MANKKQQVDLNGSRNNNIKYGKVYSLTKISGNQGYKRKNNGFHSGQGQIGRAVKLSGEDGFVLAKTGEEILSLDKIKQMKEVFTAMNPLVNAMNGIDVPNTTNNNNSDIASTINMEINLPNVTNYDEFIKVAQSDKRFEKIIQQMTLGNITGKNSLAKMKY